VVVVELSDAQARLLAQVLNRTRGKDDPVALERLLEELLMSVSPAGAAAFLPEAEATLERILLAAQLEDELDADDAPGLPAEAETRPGELLGLVLTEPHSSAAQQLNASLRSHCQNRNQPLRGSSVERLRTSKPAYRVKAHAAQAGTRLELAPVAGPAICDGALLPARRPVVCEAKAVLALLRPRIGRMLKSAVVADLRKMRTILERRSLPATVPAKYPLSCAEHGARLGRSLAGRLYVDG
jgi:hypothetical protein